jgi:hypothetical protein
MEPREVKKHRLFVNKKKQKNFLNVEHGLRQRRCHTTASDSKDFFGSFLQKITAWLRLFVSTLERISVRARDWHDLWLRGGLSNYGR